LHYTLYNNNQVEWVIFIHGIGGNSTTWEEQLHDLGVHYNILTIDLPGHGESSIAEYISPLTLSTGIKNILDKEGIRMAYFVGLSLGSMVCAHFAITYPTYVKKIIFASSIIQVNLFCKICAIIAKYFYKFLPYRILYNLAIYVVAPQKQYKEDRKNIRNGFDKMSRANLIAWVSYMTWVLDGNHLAKALVQLKKTYTFISGAKDMIFLSGAKKAANAMVGGRISIIDKAGHMCNRDNIKKFNNLVCNFLK
jgi:pimeloyl-ACP methyl ester carboxylesterase